MLPAAVHGGGGGGAGAVQHGGGAAAVRADPRHPPQAGLCPHRARPRPRPRPRPAPPPGRPPPAARLLPLPGLELPCPALVPVRCNLFIYLFIDPDYKLIGWTPCCRAKCHSIIPSIRSEQGKGDISILVLVLSYEEGEISKKCHQAEH